MNKIQLLIKSSENDVLVMRVTIETHQLSVMHFFNEFISL